MHWIADRFFLDGERWIDIASGNPVHLFVSETGTAAEEVEWNERCARLACVRHPLLVPLIDYGRVSPLQRFEAYAGGSPRKRAAPAGRLRDHLEAMLSALDLTLDGRRAAGVIRESAWAADHPVGIILQPRPSLDLVRETLERDVPIGPSSIQIVGPPGIGLRTFMTCAARAARLLGFVPVRPGRLRLDHEPLAAVIDRHLCVIQCDEDPPALVDDLVRRAAGASTRRHIVMRFSRCAAPASLSLAVERLSQDALVRMVFLGPHDQLDADRLQRAARAADGLPGAMLSALSPRINDRGSNAFVVHESRSEYVVAPASVTPEPPVIAGRVLGSALRASARAAALERRGRHAAAVRVLTRALHVLSGRERCRDAALCAYRLGQIALDRGRTDQALALFARAIELRPGEPEGHAAVVAHGVALTDAGRLVEAEAALRGAVLGASGCGTDAQVAAAAALARALFWQRRYHDAVAVAAAYRPHARSAAAGSRLLAAHARAEARLGRSAAALRTAREAQTLAAASEDPRPAISAELTLADLLLAAGDKPAARAALARAVRLARTAHLPLFRVRALLIRIAVRETGWQRLAGSLGRLHLPPLLERRLRECTTAATPIALEPVSELERMLDITQRSPDERTALARICKDLIERLGAGSAAVLAANERALAVHGRLWGSMTAGVREVIACGSSVAPDLCREPLEAAEPVRYGGEVVAAVACHWPAGSLVDRDGVALVLRAAALSAAAPVRALLDTAVATSVAGGDLLGESPQAASIRQAVSRAARAPFPVLIEGESGSGKELVARGIHRESPRRNRKFCALNCAALSDELIEAELFGHTRGAFTGAAADRPGLFEEADGGTLFLDEVGELSARAQAKLLRVLQDGEVRRVGENFARRVDVRVVAATNRSLEQEAAAGRFRADLRFRLDVIRITVPPLRERQIDVPLLANHFWCEAVGRVGSHATLSPDAVAALARYQWPGNVRELQNVIAWMAVHAPRRGRVGMSALPAHIAQALPDAAGAPSGGRFEQARAEFERRFIKAALADANGCPAHAAAALGITRQGLAKMMRRLQIEAP